MKFEILNDVEYLKDIAENSDFFLDAIKGSDTYILRKMKDLNVPIPLSVLRQYPNYLSYPEIIDAIKDDLTIDESVLLVVNGYWNIPFKKEIFSSPLLKEYVYDKNRQSGSYVIYALEDADYITLDALNNLDKLLVSNVNASDELNNKIKESLSKLSVDEIEKSLSVHYFLTPELNEILMAKGANISNRENYWLEMPRAAFLVADTEVDAVIDNYRKFKDTFCFMALNPKLLNADFFRRIIEINPDVSSDELLNGYLNNSGVWRELIEAEQDTVIFPAMNGREEFTVKDFWKNSLEPKSFINLNEMNRVFSLDIEENFDEILKVVGDNANSPIMKGALNYLKSSPFSGISYEYKPSLSGSEMREFLAALYDVLPEGATSINLSAIGNGGKAHFTGTSFKEQIEMLQDAWERGDKELISAWAGLLARCDLTDDSMSLFFNFTGIKNKDQNKDSQSFAGFMFVEILKQAPESLNKYLFARECLKKVRENVKTFELDTASVDEIVHIFKGFPEDLKDPMNELLFNKPITVDAFNKIADFGAPNLNIFSKMRNKINSNPDSLIFESHQFKSRFLNHNFVNLKKIAPLIFKKTEDAFVQYIKGKIEAGEKFSLPAEIAKNSQFSGYKNEQESYAKSLKNISILSKLTANESNYVRNYENAMDVNIYNIVNKFEKCLRELLPNVEMDNGKTSYLTSDMDGYSRLMCQNFHYELDFNNNINLLNFMVELIESQDNQKRDEIIFEISQNCTKEMKDFLLEVCGSFKKSENVDGIEFKEGVVNGFISFFEKESFKNIQEIADNYKYSDFLLYNYSILNEQNPDYLKKFFLRENPSFILNTSINNCILDDDAESPIAPLKSWEELRSFIENDLIKKDKSVLLASVKELSQDENLYGLFFNQIDSFAKDILNSGEDFKGLLKMLGDIKDPLAYVSILSDSLFELIREKSNGKISSTSSFLREGFYTNGLKDLINLNLDSPENLLIVHKIKGFLPLIPNSNDILKEILDEKIVNENSILLRNLLLVHAEGEITTDSSKLITLCKGDTAKALSKILSFPHQSEEIFNFIDFVENQSNKLLEKNKDTSSTLFRSNEVFNWLRSAKIKTPNFQSILEAKRSDVMLTKKIQDIVDNSDKSLNDFREDHSFKL